MDFFDQFLQAIVNQDFPVVWGLVSLLVSYLVFHQRQICKNMDDYQNEVMKLLRESKYRHDKIEEEIELLRQSVKEDIAPIVRKLELDFKDINELNKAFDEAKVDQRGWFKSIHDDFNQFRSEFRDILKLVLNGKKIDK